MEDGWYEEEKRKPMRPQGPKKAERVWHDDAGNALTYNEWRKWKSAKRAETEQPLIEAERRAKEAERQEAVLAVFEAEMDNRGILYNQTALPKKKSETVKFRCGCPRAKTFESTPHRLALLPRNKTCCPRCKEFKAEDKLREVIENKGGVLLSGYSDAHTKVKVRCYYGHVFHATPANLTRVGGKRGTWCPVCDKLHGEWRLGEALAERGMVLTVYGEDGDRRRQDKHYLNHLGEPEDRDHSRLLQIPPVFGPQGERPVRVFYDDDTMYAYALIGWVPPKLPRLIADVVEKNDYTLVTNARNLERADAAFRQAINDERVGGDYRLLNVLHNPDWISPGRYSWGEIESFTGTLVPTTNGGT